MLIDICRPTFSKVLGKKYRLMRGTEYTTNGFWVLSTACEPKWMSRLKETGPAPEGMQKLIDEAVAATHIPIQYDYRLLDIGSGTPTVMLTSEGGAEYHINAYYLSLFNSLKLDRRDVVTTLFATGEPKSYKPIVVKSVGGRLVGLIMPINK